MEEDCESFSAPKLPFLHIPPPSTASMDSPSHPSTPPLQTSASVPFKWEEQPGKPRPCTDIIRLPEPARCLGLPPCRTPILFIDSDKITKTPSPTTVLDGPYNVGRPKFSSFRFFKEAHDSFDSLGGTTPEGKRRGGGLFGKFKGGKKVGDGGSCRFSPSSVSSCESGESCSVRVKNGGGVKMTSKRSFSSVPQARSSHLWTSIYQGIKQAIQWKSSGKSNKEGRV